MPWAMRRRFIILGIIGAILIAFFAVVSITTFYKAPSCADAVQNQGESGVDCGGPCPYLCTAEEQPPTVLFTQPLSGSAGRTDVIASVENKNATAGAKNVPYMITLYGTDSSLIQTVAGTFDLPAGATEPVYVPNILTGKHAVAHAFLTINSSSPRWFSMTSGSRSVPSVSNIVQSSTPSTSRVDAVLVNPSTMALTNVKVIVLVRSTSGDVIAASQTIIPAILARGQSTATFTWNTPFKSTPAAIEVTPIIPLP